ncbi:hypothetical protein, variant 2 [Aphanomyces invadans]|uniref:Ubiquitin-like domain-containing protein n=1 Tax=Aphanomyces invadans TaxID=157072 RepID=A0A024UQI9_9STRA|nr:hypothetical protein, variant 2 [Aphanomyces invadans]ETW08564.1 hypothetical protein, variant 2 [Aphanomyces invadans]|eukprot:XP_008862370.1 hypothetical protein, variant 2 [Aphanomyces invadans]
MMQADDITYGEGIDLESQPLIDANVPTTCMLTLRVKTLSEKPLNIDINATATVGDLKDMIKTKGHAEGKFLRLIHQGKLLNDDKAVLLSSNVKNNDFIHCAMSSVPPKSLVQQMTHQQDDVASDEPNHRRGFDCLRDTLTREEVQALRLHFYPQVSAMISQSVAREGESVEDRIYRVEEEWMAAQGPQSEFGKPLLHVDSHEHCDGSIECSSSWGPHYDGVFPRLNPSHRYA